jgi:hypothetical protein
MEMVRLVRVKLPRLLRHRTNLLIVVGWFIWDDENRHYFLVLERMTIIKLFVPNFLTYVKIKCKCNFELKQL